MKPGDSVTCFTCGAYARVWTTGAQHQDGWPVLVTWATPGGERTMIEDTGAAARPLSCRACGATIPGTGDPNTERGEPSQAALSPALLPSPRGQLELL